MTVNSQEFFRNSKLKEIQTEKSKTFQEIPKDFLESLGIFCEI